TLSRLLLSFSMYTNAKKLMSTKQTAGSLTAINGIRAISISWVVLGHTFIFVITFSSNFNVWLPEMLQRWSFQPINNALVCVDSFFAMRLTPAYMLLLLFDVGLLRYLGDGPFWPRQGFETNQCKNNWWWNLLYLNNFLDNGNPSCFAWGWYLANDMQFFLISPLFLLPLYHNEVLGVILCCLSVVGTWVATGILSTHYGMPPSLFGGGGTNAFGNYYQWYYEKPFCRLGPYIVGILTGYALFKSRCRVKINKYLNLLTWAVATALAVTILYGLRDPIVESPMSTQVSALYNTTHRTVWGACVCWVIFACATGNGGFINTLLSWRTFGPFARMSYCIYLIHPLVMYLYYGNLREMIYLADLSGIYLFLGNLVASCMAAFVASLLFEAPMLGLEKVAFRRGHK
ncbi:hypothetical protein FSP39_024750, partial [Pinctada imbricata]